jgi:predicted nucleotidyltransferase
MNRATALQALSEHKAQLTQRFGIASIALFGSIARDAAKPGSDVDLLVSFVGPATSAQFFGVQFYLEDVMGCTVDLVTEKALRPELRPLVLRDAVHV